ncbi:MAG: DUF447 family protein [Methylotenera sp.]|nr:DUF447 family protein [Methylotenera sp.]
MIYEAIISTLDAQGKPHVAPFGVRDENDLVVISPFKPSSTLENILVTQCATMNLTDDVRIFAGALTRHQSLNLTPTTHIQGVRLANTLAHKELKLVKVQDDAIRPKLFFEVVCEAQHQIFQGFNRAQAAVIELAVLASRLHLLPRDKIENEIKYLKIAIDKTAGERELQAWGWLIEKIDNFYATQSGENLA